MSWITTLGKLIIRMNIIVWELTQLLGLQHSSYVCDIAWVLWRMSLGKLSIDSNCVCFLWYFQGLFKCQRLYHLNYLVSWFCYDHWPCAWSLYNYSACLLLPIIGSSGVMKFKSCPISYDLGFVAHDFRKAQHTHCINFSFRACSVH